MFATCKSKCNNIVPTLDQTVSHVISGCILFIQLYYEPSQGTFHDDTAVNGMEIECRGPGMDGTGIRKFEQKEFHEDYKWSRWSSRCIQGTAVCALKTRVEPEQETRWGVDGDDAALTDAWLYCCEY